MVYKNFSFSTPFLRGYRELKIPIISPDGTPAWPEMFPAACLEELRQTVGARYFSAQMMLEFIAPDRAKLDPDALRLYNDDFNPHTARLGEHTVTGATVYWDPSTGRKNADGSVCILLYRDDKTKNLFIHDVAYLVVPDDEVHPLARQCEMVLCFMQRHGIYRICVETNGLGNALPEIMRDVCARRNVTVTIQKIISHQRKETRILDAIEPVLTAGRLHAHVRIQSTPLIAEMLGWTPVGTIGHDDGLDALAGAICAQPIPVRPLGRSAQIFSANTDFKI